MDQACQLFRKYLIRFNWLSKKFDKTIKTDDDILAYLTGSSAQSGVYLLRGNQHWYTVHIDNSKSGSRMISDSVERCQLDQDEMTRRGWVFTKAAKLMGRQPRRKRNQQV